MTDFQEYALISALEEISHRDPCPSKNPDICDYMTEGRPCIGCVSRAALKAYKEAACTTQK